MRNVYRTDGILVAQIEDTIDNLLEWLYEAYENFGIRYCIIGTKNGMDLIVEEVRL